LQPRPGKWDSNALQRYREMLQALREHGIQPMVCLHHFTHPAWFEELGGFLHRDAPLRFEEFAARVVAGLSDLCDQWVTINEPNVYAALGYVLAEFPPGAKGKVLSALRVINNLARSHARAYRSIHEIQPQAEVGWAQHFAVFNPADNRSFLDRWTARNMHALFNETFLRIIEHGSMSFPLTLLEGDLQEAVGTCDFVGLNVYSRFRVEFNLKHIRQLCANVFVPPDVPQGDAGTDRPYGEAYPPAIRYAVQRASKLHKPMYILENGVPDATDRIRPWLMVNAIKEVHSLVTEGHDIRGYFHWTLTDNFEWSEGWRLRFGLVELDPETQKRTLRRSAELFREIAHANGIPDHIAEKVQSDHPTVPANSGNSAPSCSTSIPGK
jgi:beta-glucosidase